ncbi:hypothetical protein KGF57_005148 [Candida theae]|uniref:Uncharacterized protein n=1 Tax=Candida theae TaxID=1198502 RepID=A0AAD5B984_9ASCO|nr:uncharacterized protein KGF57_005148 [Candida theae]KAI5948750.1 hypothetical protein KGF57_005148 [Candida theae]
MARLTQTPSSDINRVPDHMSALWKALGIDEFIRTSTLIYREFNRKRTRSRLTLKDVQSRYSPKRVSRTIAYTLIRGTFPEHLQILGDEMSDRVVSVIFDGSKLENFAKEPTNEPFTNLEQIKAINYIIRSLYRYFTSKLANKELNFVERLATLSWSLYFGVVYENKCQEYKPTDLNPEKKKIFNAIHPVSSSEPVRDFDFDKEKLLEIDLKYFVRRPNPISTTKDEFSTIEANNLPEFQLKEVLSFENEAEFSRIIGHTLFPIISFFTNTQVKEQEKRVIMKAAMVPDAIAENISIF